MLRMKEGEKKAWMREIERQRQRERDKDRDRERERKRNGSRNMVIVVLWNMLAFVKFVIISFHYELNLKSLSFVIKFNFILVGIYAGMSNK